MTQHLSFLDDAEERFIEAFGGYERLVAATTAERRIGPACQCVRGLYLALEKGLKHALAAIDPYLLIAKPDRGLLLQLRKDMLSRPAPSIFCSRQPFETIGLTQTWEALRDLAPPAVDDEILADFDRSLNRLCQERNRAQHGEVVSEVDDILALVGQLLARFLEVIGTLVPELMERLRARDGQLESRLRAIENDVDAGWQVLADYLQSHGPIQISVRLFTILERESENIETLLGTSDRTDTHSRIVAGCDVPRSMASGLFETFLTKQQAEDRYTARRRLAALAAYESPRASNKKSSGQGAERAVIPMSAGRITIPTTSAWLTLYLPSVTPHHLSVSATLTQLEVRFDNSSKIEGRVTGRLECAVQKGAACAKALSVEGAGYLRSEWHFEGDPAAEPAKRDSTQRVFDLELALDVSTGKP